MASTHTLTGNVYDLTGATFGATGIRVTVVTNLPAKEALIDKTTNSIHLGGKTADLNPSTGVFTVDLIDTSATDLNVVANTLEYEVRAEYVNPGTRARSEWASGWFPITADVNLADVATDASPMASVSASTYAVEAAGYRDQTETLRNETATDRAYVEARVVEDLGTTDAQTKALVETPTSETAIALSATYGRGVSVKAFGATGDGTTDDTAAIQSAMNGYSLTGGTVYLPEGTYRITAPIDLAKWVRVTGAGIEATTIESDHAGHALRYAGTFTASNPRRIEVANLRITGGTTGTGISIVAAALVDIHRVHVAGFEHGIVFQGVTHGDIDKSTLENFQETGVWIANASDYTPGPAVSPPQNNRLTVQRCNIRSDVAGSVGVCDDGGWNHEVSRNSFEGCTTQLRVTGMEGFLATNNEYESADGGPFIVLGGTTRAGTNVGTLASITLSDSVLDAPASQVGIAVAGSISYLTVSGFNFHTLTGIAAITGLGSVERLAMTQTRNWGAGPLTDGSRATVAHWAPSVSRSDLNLLGGKITSDGAAGADTMLFDLGNGTGKFGIGRGNTSLRGTTDVYGGAADSTGHGVRVLVNGSLALEVLGNGAGSQVKFSEARDMVFGSTTGTKIGTAAGQKLAFYGATPRTQPGSYTIGNPTALRVLDGSATSPNTLGEVIQVLGRLITDLKSVGIIG